MKKLIIYPRMITILMMGFFFCGHVLAVDEKKQSEAILHDFYLGSDCQGNYVWGAAMNLAWNELCENILKEKLRLNSSNQSAINMAEKLNTNFITKWDLNPESYYVKSGFGISTVEAINRDSRKKFPGKSFKDLDIKLSPEEFMAYAYFLKEVEYPVQFKEKEMRFEEKFIKGFYAEGNTQRENVVILKYYDKNRFIIRLKLKDESDELMVAKGFDMSQPSEILSELNILESTSFQRMEENDVFQMPKLHLNHHRDYAELIGQSLANEKFKNFVIAQMFENIQFDLDHKGARVENEAVIAVVRGALPVKLREPKELVLDKPFWVIMKGRAQSHPYFMLGVKNSELMEPAENI